MEFTFAQANNITESIIFSRSSSKNSVNQLHLLMMTIPDYRTAMDLNKYCLLVIVSIGSLANLSAFLLMLNLCSITMCNYMVALAIADTSVLLGPGLIRWLLTQDVDPRNYNTALCRFLYFQNYWSFALSAWTLVAMTVDRFVAISFPLRARAISTPRRAWIVIVVLAFVLTLLNCHFFFTMEVHSTGQACVGLAKYEHFLQTIWPWVDAAVYSFLPFSLLLIFNILIIINHRRYLKINVMMTGLGTIQNGVSTPNRNRRLTIMLLAVTFTFMLLTGPRALLFIIRDDVLNFRPTPNTINFKVLAKYTLTSSVVNLLMFTNHGINFFLYCLTGKKFRQQILQIFRTAYRNLIKSRKPSTLPSVTSVTSSIHLNRCTSVEERKNTMPTIHETEE